MEIVAVGSAIDHGVRAPWSTSSFWSETGGRTMYYASAWRAFVEPAGMRIEASTEKPLWVQLTMLLAKRSFSSLRSRKNAMTH